MRSIQRTLLWWLALGLLAGIAAATALIYGQARQEANALFDYQMRQVALALPSQFNGPALPSLSPPLPPGTDNLFRSDEDVVIHIWDGTGRSLYLSHSRPSLPPRAELGFSNVRTDDGEFRIYSVQLGPAVVQIAQPMSARREVAARMALRTVAPLLLLLPLLGWMVWLAVGRGLRPVREIARQVGKRDANALSPLAVAEMPAEIAPLTEALNLLLARLSDAIDTQRAFIADAAHALRTPLTALQLQAQLVERADSEPARREAVGNLRDGLERLTHLVTQLLTLARHEPGAAVAGQQPVALRELAATVVGEMTQAALDRNIDLGLDASGDGDGDGDDGGNGRRAGDAGAGDAAGLTVQGDPDALRILLTNLIDNALRYVSAGGKVDVRVQRADAGRVALIVADNGPGIPPEQRARVLDRFYRLPDAPSGGSGLGLAIVDEIAQVHRATLSLEDNEPGLRVRVVFPEAGNAQRTGRD
ncbi:sensory histidine kinase in two-component regulatory system [Cupriavidus gilardii CR3]|uniref:histidine kinase n=1 Tax=Cupriavidus gilardii TaxID=82541 RepID=A0A849BI25_9BURK|nr:ATP-binding protein [Cupriavidus gilardii]ALD93726.1 sensory histidine kinase in two-component regulatory system [Cupriavidus gilardii CR3]KAB0596978.1 two-component sensor histidine kinase [Cupriavidus gilardii]MCT9014965.1 ATP-binding protein [Cupriavidus gilardii]MCT9053377.1 ATP-binding protein [Cupriavidus gilardii]NNH10299.1 two-component sensor histidine kinase [Cupriavidus gilardii]